MVNDNVSVGARALLGEHVCQLMLRPTGEIPGGLWSWRVYVDGNVQSRGPGSKGIKYASIYGRQSNRGSHWRAACQWRASSGIQPGLL